MQDRAAKGEDVEGIELPEVPFEYTMLKYRQKMRISYRDALETPAEVLMHDLEMLDIEAEYGPRPRKMQ